MNKDSEKNINSLKNDKEHISNVTVKNEKDIREINKIIINLEKNIKEKAIKIKNLLENYDEINKRMKDIMEQIKFEINNEFNKQEAEKNKKMKLEHDSEYKNKIRYKFVKDPTKLKFKSDITTTNASFGYDLFEIYISYKNNKEYLVSPNSINYNLYIFKLKNNQIVASLRGHENQITTIRYFINFNSKNEYLISADINKYVIIWDITNNYKKIQSINTKYKDSIFSCLLMFPIEINNFYIITSSFANSGNDEDSSTKLYLSSYDQPTKYIKNTNNIPIFYLLPWFNKQNKKNYLIQFSSSKIIINDILSDEKCKELVTHPGNHYSGLIYSEGKKDYLLSPSSNGYVYVYELYNPNDYIKSIINTNGCLLTNIINWGNDCFIITDFHNKFFKIFHNCFSNNMLMVDNVIDSCHNDKLVCIKKINHPIYGESLLSAANDNKIKLWILD